MKGYTGQRGRAGVFVVLFIFKLNDTSMFLYC